MSTAEGTPSEVRWWRSVIVRLTVGSVLLSTIALGGVFGFLYWRALDVVEYEVADTVATEMRTMAEHYRDGGLPGLVQLVQERSAVPVHADSVYLVVDQYGNRLAGNLLAWPPNVLPDGKWRRLELYRQGDQQPLLIGGRATSLVGGARLLLGRVLEGRVQIQEAIGEAVLVSVVVLWGLIVGGGLLLSRIILRRVDEVAAINREVMRGDLQRRVPVRGAGDEFDRLAVSMNAMFARIEELMIGMRTVTDSVGHDLRSPLTRLRTRLERARAPDAPENEREEALDGALLEVDSTLDLLGRLLEIARAETGLSRDQMTEIDLAAVAADMADLYGPSAEDCGLAIELEADGPLPVLGHGELLAQAVSNLVDNAIKYAAGRIRIAADRDDEGLVRISIADDGPGIPAEDRERAMLRFVRLDPSRTGKGVGLGLSLVAAVARLHGGSLELADAGPGLRAEIVLPASENIRP